MELPVPRLAAPVQLRNAAVAIAALRALPRLPKPLPRLAFSDGIERANVGGRLQRFERDGVEIVVDVGHNPQAASALADWLRTAPASGRVIAVYAALSDKDVVGVVEALAPVVDVWQLAGLADAGPRGGDVESFAARLAGTRAGDGVRHATVVEALAAARARALPGDRVLVFGSFHTAAAALESLARD
jgi:dihydrofolate synthase/folylpolyglutamate synthase